ncbi:MAG: pirin family protein [Bacteroidales bacterium]|nr:pirin family protein [Bacteroidales bacterium]MCF8454625.1 pirin family protein [Bacteroidales bacterium]
MKEPIKRLTYMTSKLSRRKFINKTGLVTAGSVIMSQTGIAKKLLEMTNNSPILRIKPLSSPWETQYPFIFCAYHYDEYPGGNDELGPNRSLKGRNIGQDFAGKDGWNMYHGSKVPGFPAHPHSGFETVTVVTKGLVDHSDSLGAAGRFGKGDVQWLTAGKGVQHAEMFPLLNKDSNPFELFQIWLNLPVKSKKVEPHYKMLWSEDIPVIKVKDTKGNETHIKLVAGYYGNQVSLPPTPDSWAADPQNHVQIWTIKMDGNVEFIIPAIKEEVTRSLYFYQGDAITIGEKNITQKHHIELDSEKEVKIINGSKEGSLLFLQGRPIDEPIIQYGPFVANTKADLQETIQTYQRTQFGGWPWATSDPVHDKSKGRFSLQPDGTEVIK